MANDILTKAFKAGGTITAKRIVKPGAADDTVVAAAAATDFLLGVAQDSAVSGGRLDVQVMGVAFIKAGGTVTRGNEVTSDASGQGVAAAPGAGVNNRVIGIALDSAVSGDEFKVLIVQSVKQG